MLFVKDRDDSTMKKMHAKAFAEYKCKLYVKDWKIGSQSVFAPRRQTLHLSGVVWAAHLQRGPGTVIQE